MTNTLFSDVRTSLQFLDDVRAVVEYHWSGLDEKRPAEAVWARLDAVLFDDELARRARLRGAAMTIEFLPPEQVDALRRAKEHYFNLYDDASAEGDHVGTVRDLYEVWTALDGLYRTLAGESGREPGRPPAAALFECPDCKAQQPEPGRCERCPGVVQPVRWDAGACYICGVHVPPRDGWHREDYDGISRHWCPDHQPVWSRP